MPRLSVTMWRLSLGCLRSVGFGPVTSPPYGWSATPTEFRHDAAELVLSRVRAMVLVREITGAQQRNGGMAPRFNGYLVNILISKE